MKDRQDTPVLFIYDLLAALSMRAYIDMCRQGWVKQFVKPLQWL